MSPCFMQKQERMWKGVLQYFLIRKMSCSFFLNLALIQIILRVTKGTS